METAKVTPINTAILHQAMEVIRAIQGSEIGQALVAACSDEIFNREQAAEFLGVSTWTLDELRKKSGLPAADLGGTGGRIVFRKSALLEWVAQQERATKKAKFKRIT